MQKNKTEGGALGTGTFGRVIPAVIFFSSNGVEHGHAVPTMFVLKLPRFAKVETLATSAASSKWRGQLLRRTCYDDVWISRRLLNCGTDV